MRWIVLILFLAGCDYTPQEWRDINAALADLNRSTSYLADQMPHRQYNRPSVHADHERRLRELEWQQQDYGGLRYF